EPDPIAGPQLADAVAIGADDLANLRVAANGLAVHAEDNALAVARDLHGTGTNRLRDEVAVRQRQRFALQAQAHAIAHGRDGELASVEIGQVEPFGLGAGDNAKGLRRRRWLGKALEDRG